MSKERPLILVIYNPAAQGGASKHIWEQYTQYLGTKKLNYVGYTTLGDGEEIGINKLLENNDCQVISIIGGDGTVNLVINALSSKTIPLHIIPAGSGNDLAKMIYPDGIPRLEKIFSLVIKEKPDVRPLDIWRCNNQLFANGFGCGFDGSIAYDTKFKIGWLGSKMKYWVEIVKHIFFYKSPQMTVNGNTQRTFMLSAANGSTYGGDFKVAPLAVISDSKLEVIRIKKVWVPLRFYYLPLLLMGKHLNKKIVEYEQSDRVVISSDKPIPAHLDGEPMCETDYVISKKGQVMILI